MKRYKYPYECVVNFKRGWWCSRLRGHDGPCALRPNWWNLRDVIWYYL